MASLLGRLALCQGDAASARCLIEEGLELYKEIGYWTGYAESLCILGSVAASLGDYAAAHARYRASLAAGRAVDENQYLSSCLEGLAEVFLAQGEPVRAVRLWGAAAARREALGTPIPPLFQADYERSLAVACSQLTEQAFATAWSEGCTLELEQVPGVWGSPDDP